MRVHINKYNIGAMDLTTGESFYGSCKGNLINHTLLSTFLLLDFSETRQVQILHVTVFLVLYLITMTGNLLIITAVIFNHHLHKPMYFFLINLAVMDIGSVSVILPKSIINSLTNNSSISYSGCVAQVFFCFFFVTSDLAVLMAMSYDRYVAICNPLQYERIMHKRSCIQISVIVCIVSLLYASLQTSGTFAIPYCSNIVCQFFCEVPAILKLSCSDMYLVEVGFLAFGCSLGVGCFIYIITTYIQIFSAVQKIPSSYGQRKALSTCFPHLAVVSLFIFTSLFAYARPPHEGFSDTDVVFSVLYSVIPPVMNPFIYSMRNKEVKNALWKLLLVFGQLFKTFSVFVL